MLDDWGVDLAADVFPMSRLMVLPPEVTLETEHLFRQTHAWLSPEGSVTPGGCCGKIVCV